MNALDVQTLISLTKRVMLLKPTKKQNQQLFTIFIKLDYLQKLISSIISNNSDR